MVRIALGIAALACCTAASPATTFIMARTAGADALARIEQPSQNTPDARFTAAPVPNSSLNAPIAVQSNAPTLAPSLFAPKSVYHGEGFVSGSTNQTAQEAKLRPGIGGTLSVPLQ